MQTESMVARILKEAAMKTAAPKHQTRSDPTPTSSSETPASATRPIRSRAVGSRHVSILLIENLCTCSIKSGIFVYSQSLRKSAANQKKVVVVNDAPSTKVHEEPTYPGNDMMALRARMTERLQQRNREIGKSS